RQPGFHTFGEDAVEVGRHHLGVRVDVEVVVGSPGGGAELAGRHLLAVADDHGGTCPSQCSDAWSTVTCDASSKITRSNKGLSAGTNVASEVGETNKHGVAEVMVSPYRSMRRRKLSPPRLALSWRLSSATSPESRSARKGRASRRRAARALGASSRILSAARSNSSTSPSRRIGSKPARPKTVERSDTDASASPRRSAPVASTGSIPPDSRTSTALSNPA